MGFFDLEFELGLRVAVGLDEENGHWDREGMIKWRATHPNCRI